MKKMIPFAQHVVTPAADALTPRAIALLERLLAGARQDLRTWTERGIPTAQKTAEIAALEARLGCADTW